MWRLAPWASPVESADMTLVLDAGGLIAIDRRDRQVGALLFVAQQNSTRVMTSAVAVAQVWRSGQRQANLARALAGVQIFPVDYDAARRIGGLLRVDASTDVVDAHIALLVAESDVVLTSDSTDIERLLDTRGIKATVKLV
jgi:hypothetical protein